MDHGSGGIVFGETSGEGIMTDEEFMRHALEVLNRELGADGLARFLPLSRSGPGG